MIDRTHPLPVSRQAKLVGIARSSAYYRAQPVSQTDQLLMQRIDEHVPTLPPPILKISTALRIFAA